MSLLTCASKKSVWRGYNYFKEGKITSFEQLDEHRYIGGVIGSGDNFYVTMIDIAHPRKSKCDCPHAEGKQIVCKHMVALYFAIFPDEAENYFDEQMQYEEEAEQYAEIIQSKMIRYINHMKKAELQQALIDLLLSGPEWQYDHFIRFYDIDVD